MIWHPCFAHLNQFMIPVCAKSYSTLNLSRSATRHCMISLSMAKSTLKACLAKWVTTFSTRTASAFTGHQALACQMMNKSLHQNPGLVIIPKNKGERINRMAKAFRKIKTYISSMEVRPPTLKPLSQRKLVLLHPIFSRSSRQRCAATGKWVSASTGQNALLHTGSTSYFENSTFTVITELRSVRTSSPNYIVHTGLDVNFIMGRSQPTC